MKFTRDGWKFGMEFGVPAWILRLFRMQPDPRTVAHGESGRSKRYLGGAIEVEITEKIAAERADT